MTWVEVPIKINIPNLNGDIFVEPVNKEISQPFIDPVGNKMWYKNGKYHREDGPAVECANGHKEWYRNGKRHREDGPAIEYASGGKAWYYNNKEYTEVEYKTLMYINGISIREVI